MLGHFGMIPLINHDSRLRSQWRRYNLPRSYMYNHHVSINQNDWSNSKKPLFSRSTQLRFLLRRRWFASNGGWYGTIKGGSPTAQSHPQQFIPVPTGLNLLALYCSTTYKGGPNSVSKNHISFRCQKRTQKLVPCTCLSRSWQSFPFCYVDERGPVSKACNRGASRLGEAWPRPRLGRNTYWHKDKARLTGTRNYIILLSKSQQGWTWSSW